MEEEMLSTAQAAKVLGLTPQMVRLAARAGRIKAYHPYAGCAKFVFKYSELKKGLVSAAD